MRAFGNVNARTPQGATKRCTLGERSALKGGDFSLRFAHQFENPYFHRSANSGFGTDHQTTRALDRAHHFAMDLRRRPEKNRAHEATFTRD